MSDKHSEQDFQKLREQVIGDGSYDASIVLSRLLMTLLFKNKLVGTTYLKEAVLYRFEKSDVSRLSLTNDIYPAVANKLDTTVNRVERAIRNAINDCHEHGNLFAFNDITRSPVIKEEYPPTNGELISNIASWLSLERQQRNIK